MPIIIRASIFGNRFLKPDPTVYIKSAGSQQSMKALSFVNSWEKLSAQLFDSDNNQAVCASNINLQF